MTKKRAVASSSDDEDEETRRRLQSCTDETSTFLKEEKVSTAAGQNRNGSELKLCQVRLYDLLHQYLDTNLEFRNDEPGPSTEQVVQEVHVQDEQGFQLFKSAPPGIKMEQRKMIEQVERGGTVQKMKPRPSRLRKWKLDSYESKSALESVVVDGDYITAESRRAADKALEKWRTNLLKKAKVVAAEESRVSMLKAQRGEQWLPSFLSDKPTAKATKKKKS